MGNEKPCLCQLELAKRTNAVAIEYFKLNDTAKPIKYNYYNFKSFPFQSVTHFVSYCVSLETRYFQSIIAVNIMNNH